MGPKVLLSLFVSLSEAYAFEVESSKRLPIFTLQYGIYYFDESSIHRPCQSTTFTGPLQCLLNNALFQDQGFKCFLNVFQSQDISSFEIDHSVGSRREVCCVTISLRSLS